MAIPLNSLAPGQPQQPVHQHAEEAFQYQALDSQNTFRLLRLHAGQGDRIDCSMHHHTLGSATGPAYRAVSYTWGDDAARFDIHFPDNSVIKVRENLRNALQFLRDTQSSCWLWIDAICINQDSNDERNHQARLIAEIYGNANVVLVWLQSTHESTDVAKAFRFVKAAARHNTSSHSVLDYCTAHSGDSESDWQAVRAFCRLRYWTRKWSKSLAVIQELVSARTVVLQAGPSQCSMADLETLCFQLKTIGPDGRIRNNSERLDPMLWKPVLDSPAARLALERTEAGNPQQQPRLLHQLVERYESNQCKMPCDHVYALYSLVGAHRQHLRIDYNAWPVERLVEVLDFAQTYDHLQPFMMLGFTNLLVKLFQIGQEELLQNQNLTRTLHAVVPAAYLGAATLLDESETSFELRRVIRPLSFMSTFSLDTSQASWILSKEAEADDPQDYVGRQDMTYFTTGASGFHGLATCRVKAGDTIWHFPTTQLVFIVRQARANRALVLGRAYLFVTVPKSKTPEPWLSQMSDSNTAHNGGQPMTTDLATLIELSTLLRTKTSLLVREDEAAWERSWHERVVMVGCILIFVFGIAAIALQAKDP